MFACRSERKVTVDTSSIRNTIQLAKQQEDISSLLAEQLQLASPTTLIAAGHCAPGSLYDFAIRYIDLVPELIECTQATAEKGNILKLVQTYLDLAASYFLAPRNSASASMIELLNEAYLAHRLFEELNDRVECIMGVPLIHFDMMQANLICHHLVGEPFANELDKVAATTVVGDEVSQALSEANLDVDWIQSLMEGRRAMSGEMVFCFASEVGAWPGGPA